MTTEPTTTLARINEGERMLAGIGDIRDARKMVALSRGLMVAANNDLRWHWEIPDDEACHDCEGEGCDPCDGTGEERTRRLRHPPLTDDASGAGEVG